MSAGGASVNIHLIHYLSFACTVFVFACTTIYSTVDTNIYICLGEFRATYVLYFVEIQLAGHVSMCESCNQTVKGSIAPLPFLKEHIKERNSRTGKAQMRLTLHGPSLVLAHARGSDVMGLRPKLASSACRAVDLLAGVAKFFLLGPYPQKNTGIGTVMKSSGSADPGTATQLRHYSKGLFDASAASCMHPLFCTPRQPVRTVS